jgi:hypothetical protein
MRALYGSWGCMFAAAHGSVPVSVSVLVPVLALASVDKFPFACRCWLLLGRHRAFPAFRFCIFFFCVHFIMCPLPCCSDYSDFVLRHLVTVWVVGCIFHRIFMFTSFSFTRCARVYFGELVFSMAIHFLDFSFLFSMDGLHPLRFEPRDVPFERCSSSYFFAWIGFGLGCTSTFSKWGPRARFFAST